MNVFITGASGFIGSAVVAELVRGGHRVVGLARSDAAAHKIAALGIEVMRGDLSDLDTLRRGASGADGVIHCGFSHDNWADRAGNLQKDRDAIAAFGDALAGTNKPLVVTNGIAQMQNENQSHDKATAQDRASNEIFALDLTARGIRASSMRLPPSVHGDGDHGFVPMLIAIARKSGKSGYIGDGANRWPAVHRLDAARLFRIALERAEPGARLHAIGDEGIPTRDIAALIGKQLGVPVESVEREHFGFLGGFFGLDSPSSARLTLERYGWTPLERGLLDDLELGTYFRQL
jgi:nucleoside-diphosphate-sugar epimerase